MGWLGEGRKFTGITRERSYEKGTKEKGAPSSNGKSPSGVTSGKGGVGVSSIPPIGEKATCRLKRRESFCRPLDRHGGGCTGEKRNITWNILDLPLEET